MKKTALLLCLFMVSVMMPQAVWAEVTYPYAVSPTLSINVSNGILTIDNSAAEASAGHLSAFMSKSDKTEEENAVITAMKNCTTIVLDGKFNDDDLGTISSDKGFTNVTLTIKLDADNTPKTLNINSSSAGLLNSYMENPGTDGHVSSDILSKMQTCTSIVLDGEFKANDLSSISESKSFSSVTKVDMSEAKFTKEFSSSGANKSEFYTFMYYQSVKSC